MHGHDDRRPRTEVLRDRCRSRLPERLQELAGPVEGNVGLPLHIVWSGRTSYSLDRPKSRMTPYRTVLAEGPDEDLTALLHHRLLTEQWPVLRRLISPCIREVWEDAFPELLRHRQVSQYPVSMSPRTLRDGCLSGYLVGDSARA